MVGWPLYAFGAGGSPRPPAGFEPANPPANHRREDASSGPGFPASSHHQTPALATLQPPPVGHKGVRPSSVVMGGEASIRILYTDVNAQWYNADMKRPLVTPDKLCEYCHGPIPPTDTSNADRRRFCCDRHRWLAWEEKRFLAVLRRERQERSLLRVAEERAEYIA